MKSLEKIQETLSFFNIICNKPYYISTGNPLPHLPNRPFRMDYYAICICLNGSIDLTINNKQHIIHAHEILLSAPNTVIKFIKASEDFQLKLLFFEKNFLLKNISNPFIIEKYDLFQLGTYSLLSIELIDFQNIINQFERLEIKSKTFGKFTIEIVRSKIFTLLLELAEIVQLENINVSKLTSNDLITRFKEMVQLEFKEYKSVDYYAKKLCISNKYLIEIIKKNLGQTPHNYIDEVMIKEAIVQLGNPKLSISQIAFDLNFQSVASFSRFFKKMVRSTPSDYRNKM